MATNDLEQIYTGHNVEDHMTSKERKVVHGKCSKIVTEQLVLQLPISEVKPRSKSIP